MLYVGSGYGFLGIGKANKGRGPVTRKPVQLRQPRLQRLAEISGHHHPAELFAAVVTRVQPEAAEIAGADSTAAGDWALAVTTDSGCCSGTVCVGGGAGATSA